MPSLAMFPDKSIKIFNPGMLYKDINILPNFDYSIACNDIKISLDSKYIVSCGTYKPSVKVHNVEMQSIISDRNIQNEPLEIFLIDSIFNYGILTSGNNIEFHNPNGLQNLAKIDMNCRSAAYFSNQVFVGGDKNIILKYDLLKNKSIESLSIDCDGIFKIKAVGSSILGLCSEYSFNIFDVKSNKIESRLEFNSPLTAFENDINTYYVGDSDGIISKIDHDEHKVISRLNNRNSPKVIKSTGDFLITDSGKYIKVWREQNLVGQIKLNSNVSAIDTIGPMIFIGLESGEMKIYHFSEMGKIPSWCGFANKILRS